MAQVTFESGTALVLEAPTEFEVRGDNEAFLHQGRATARVPEGAQDLWIRLPSMWSIWAQNLPSQLAPQE